jgi:alpha/beta superfamily hydrolase
MIGAIDLFITSHPWLYGALNLIAGAIFGNFVSHRYSIRRDRAKDFNALADPVRISLRRELKDLRANAQWVKGDDLALLIDMAHPHKRPGMRRAVKAYKDARQEHIEVDSCGDRFFTQTDHVAKAINKLLPLLHRR